MRESLVRKSIVGGPGRFKLWLNRLLGRPTALELERYGPAAVLISAVQPLEGRPGVVSFLGGRLFGRGEIMTAWGEYDTRRRTGQLWIFTVPDCYSAAAFTPWHAGKELGVA